MKQNTPIALLKFSALVIMAMFAIILVPHLIAHPALLVIAPVAAVGATPDQVKKAAYILSGKTLPSFLSKFMKSQDFVTITKDAATVIDGMRKQLGFSELDVAKALGLGDGQDAITAYDNFVSSGKGLDINADGFTALSKLFKKSVAEIAAEIVASGSEPDADDMNGDGQTAGTNDTMNNSGSPGSANPNDTTAAKSADGNQRQFAKSNQVASIRDASLGAHVIVNKAIDETKILKDRFGSQLVGTDGRPLTSDVVKASFAGIRKSVDVKKDALSPTDLTEGGTFVPVEAQGIIDLLIADSEILNKVQTFTLPQRKFRVQSHDASNLRLSRLDTGWTNTRQKGGSSFLDFDLKRVDLEFEILDDTVELFSNNVAGLENFIFNMYRQAFMNRIAYLGFNGSGGAGDDALVASAAEATLVKGWFQLATEQCAAAAKIDSDASATYHDKLKALVAAQIANQPQWETEEQVVIMSKADLQSYIDELEARLDGTTYLAMTTQQLENLTIRGHKLQTFNKVAASNFLYARFQNLAFAVLQGAAGGLRVNRYPQPGSVIYRVHMFIDFGLVNAVNEIVVSESGL